MAYEVTWTNLLKSLIVCYSAQRPNIFVKWKSKGRSEVKPGQKSLEINIFSDTCWIFCCADMPPLKGYCINLCFTVSRNTFHGFIAFFTEVRSIFVFLRTLLFFRTIIFTFDKALYLALNVGTMKGPGPFPCHTHPLRFSG